MTRSASPSEHRKEPGRLFLVPTQRGSSPTTSGPGCASPACSSACAQRIWTPEDGGRGSRTSTSACDADVVPQREVMVDSSAWARRSPGPLRCAGGGAAQAVPAREPLRPPPPRAVTALERISLVRRGRRAQDDGMSELSKRLRALPAFPDEMPDLDLENLPEDPIELFLTWLD